MLSKHEFQRAKHLDQLEELVAEIDALDNAAEQNRLFLLLGNAVAEFLGTKTLETESDEGTGNIEEDSKEDTNAATDWVFVDLHECGLFCRERGGHEQHYDEQEDDDDENYDHDGGDDDDGGHGRITVGSNIRSNMNSHDPEININNRNLRYTKYQAFRYVVHHWL